MGCFESIFEGDRKFNEGDFISLLKNDIRAIALLNIEWQPVVLPRQVSKDQMVRPLNPQLCDNESQHRIVAPLEA